MRKFNPEKELDKIKNSNQNEILYSIIALLLIVAVGSTYALYQVRHTQKLVFNTVGEFKKRDIYLSVLVDGKYKNDFPTQEEGMLYGGYECDGSAKINFDTEHWQVALYTSHPDKCTIKFGHKYVDDSGANYPELYQGMIPVYFENGKIYVADITSEWYNYDENKWANAVLIDYQNKKDKFYDDNGNLLGGHEVSEEDILQMYVWIPRYKYQLFSLGETSSTKQIINILFEEEVYTTGTVSCSEINGKETCKNAANGNWYTHPAFTFGETELPGIWVGKFEPSDPADSNGRKSHDIDSITILPGKTSIISRTVSTMFTATRNIEEKKEIKYGLNKNDIDTHMMKNIEWGAVAYLTQSIYGIYKDDNTCNIVEMPKDNCEVWINNTAQGAGSSNVANAFGGTYTGCVGDTASAGTIWNDDDGSVAKCKAGNRWNEKGVNASTTGNMYGIYDLAGGTWEYMMGLITIDDGSEPYYNTQYTGFSKANMPDPKYYDLYEFGNFGSTQERGHLGDATKETMANFGNIRGGWNNDYSLFPYADNSSVVPWFPRGGNYVDSTHVGIFAFTAWFGGTNAGGAFRVVLSAA